MARATDNIGKSSGCPDFEQMCEAGALVLGESKQWVTRP